MSKIPEEIRIRLRWVMYGTVSQRAEAEQALQGEAITLWLMATLEDELRSYTGLRRLWHQESCLPICRLAQLLANGGAPEATELLLQVAFLVSDPDEFMPGSTALRTHLEHLKARVDPHAIEVRIRALRTLIGRPGYGGDVLQLAEGLVILAERQPLPALFAALPVLRPGWRKPDDFRELHPRLKAALGDGSLPIPATPLQPTRDLPIPMEKEESK